jgi:cobalt-zinc-cadmium efflux system outer membrane protein
LTLGFAQQLVDLWQIPVRKEIATAQLQQTVFSVLDEAVRIAARTKSACFDVLWRAQLDLIARQNLKRAHQSLALAEARLRAGEANPLEAGLVRTLVLDTENESRRATRDLQNSRLALAQILGLARWPESWNLGGELDSVDPVVAPEDDLIATAMANRFDIQWADARVASAERDIDLQILKILPSLEIGLQGERTERRALPGRKVLSDTARASVAAGAPTAPTIESKGQRDLLRRQIIDSMLGPTLQLTLPIWDQNQAQIAKAGFTLQRFSKEREQLLDSVVTDVRTAANNARIAAELVSSFRDEILPQVEGNLKSAESRYENGEESVLVLLDAQEAEFVQKRLSADALRDYRTAIAELTGALGGRLEPARSPSEPEADVPNHEEVSGGND